MKGINHVGARAPGPVDEESQFAQVTDLLGQFFSGATPADIGNRARKLGNRHAAAEGGLPAAEDRSINTVDYAVTSDGRVRIRADLDAEVGAKYMPRHPRNCPHPAPNPTAPPMRARRGGAALMPSMRCWTSRPAAGIPRRRLAPNCW